MSSGPYSTGTNFSTTYGSAESNTNNDLPPGWQIGFDQFGREYYYNTTTQERRLDRPAAEPRAADPPPYQPTAYPTSIVNETTHLSPQPNSYAIGNTLQQTNANGQTTTIVIDANLLAQDPGMANINMGTEEKWDFLNAPCPFQVDPSFPSATFTITPRSMDDLEEDTCTGVLTTLFNHKGYCMVTLFVWGAIVGISFLGIMMIGLLVCTSFFYLFTVVGPAGCCPCYAPAKTCGLWGGYLLQDGVVPMYASQEVVETGEIQGALEELVNAPPKVTIMVDNFRYQKTGKRRRRITVGRYILALPVAHWEDLSPSPLTFVNEARQRGLDGTFISLPTEYFFDPMQQDAIKRMEQVLGSHFTAGTNQTVQTSIEIASSRFPDRSKRNAIIVGRDQPCCFSPTWFMLALYTTLYLPYAVCARMAVRKFMFPLRKKVTINFDVEPRFVSTYGYCPKNTVPTVQQLRGEA